MWRDLCMRVTRVCGNVCIYVVFACVRVIHVCTQVCGVCGGGGGRVYACVYVLIDLDMYAMYVCMHASM